MATTQPEFLASDSHSERQPLKSTSNMSSIDDSYLTINNDMTHMTHVVDVAGGSVGAYANTGENPNTKHKWFVFLMTVFTAVGGFLFGYDTGVISGALLYIKRQYNLSDSEQEAVVTSATIAAAVGAMFAGVIADRFGRKIPVIAAAILFIVGSTLLGIANGFAVLVVGRIVVGIAIGIASNTVPVFIAEVSPPEHRGKLVTTNIVFVTGGQFISYLVDAGFAYVNEGWRFMLALAAVPAMVQLLGMCIAIPESPRWLYANGKEAKAREVLRKIRKDSAQVEQEINEIQEAISEESSWRDVLCKCPLPTEIRLPLIVGMGLQAFQQFVGINTAMYYSATIFEMIGVGGNDPVHAIWYSCAVSAMNFIGTLVSLLLIDRAGRRPLLLSTLPIAAIGLALLGVSFKIEADYKGILALIALLIYMLGFSIGMGPVPWAINSEIYPIRIRAICASMATTVNWISNSIVSFTFLTYSNAVTPSGAFWTYAGVAVACWVFVFFLMPETKGKTIEEIQMFFKKADIKDVRRSEKDGHVKLTEEDDA